MKYYLIAGEPSGDALGAKLMQALKLRDCQAQFYGLGGEGMAACGLNSLFNISDLAIMGLAEVIPSIPRIMRRIKETIEDIKRVKPDAVITIDSWSFSERIHKKLRSLKLNISQIHYVAPQVWAWKKRRARTMHKYIDLLLTLFPNEPQYFTPYNLKAVFVGHPVIENAILRGAEKCSFKKAYKIPPKNKLMLVLPGSRHNEVKHLLPDFLETVRLLNEKHNDFSFVIPTVNTVADRVKEMVLASKLPILVVEGQEVRRQAFRDADVAIAASGTVALELAIVNVPHIVAYKVPKLTEFIVRHFVHLKYVNLTNILLNKAVVPELLQQDCTPKKMMYYVEQFMAGSPIYHRQMDGFDTVRQLLGLDKQTPSDNAAAAILAFIEKQKCSDLPEL